MNARLCLLLAWGLLLAFGEGNGGAVAAAAAGGAVATTADAAAAAGAAPAAPEADPADANVNTFFRPQDQIATTDPTKEADVPGLAATDYRKEWRAIPNMELVNPFVTSVMPMLPSMGSTALFMRWHFPMTWPLAGPAGERKDWLTTTLLVYTRAFLGRGPRPLVYPTILIPSQEAYHKLAADMKQHSGLPDMSAVHDPAKKAAMAAAVYQQLMSNLLVVATPLLAKAENGTVMMTQGKVRLTLQIKPDGSRYLVSNTTTLRLKAMDVGCEQCGPLTVQLVDSFVVPKMSPTPIKPDPIFTQEDLAKVPGHIRDILDGIRHLPKAMWDTPGALWETAFRQLPDSTQEKLQQQLPRLPQLPRWFAIDMKVLKPEQQP